MSGYDPHWGKGNRGFPRGGIHGDPAYGGKGKGKGKGKGYVGAERPRPYPYQPARPRSDRGETPTEATGITPEHGDAEMPAHDEHSETSSRPSLVQRYAGYTEVDSQALGRTVIGRIHESRGARVPIPTAPPPLTIPPPGTVIPYANREKCGTEAEANEALRQAVHAIDTQWCPAPLCARTWIPQFLEPLPYFSQNCSQTSPEGFDTVMTNVRRRDGYGTGVQPLNEGPFLNTVLEGNWNDRKYTGWAKLTETVIPFAYMEHYGPLSDAHERFVRKHHPRQYLWLKEEHGIHLRKFDPRLDGMQETVGHDPEYELCLEYALSLDGRNREWFWDTTGELQHKYVKPGYPYYTLDRGILQEGAIHDVPALSWLHARLFILYMQWFFDCAPCIEVQDKRGGTVEKRWYNPCYVFFSDLGEQFKDTGDCELFSGGCNCCFREWHREPEQYDPAWRPTQFVLAPLVPSVGTLRRDRWHFMPCKGPRDMSAARWWYGEGQHVWSKRELEHTERNTHQNRMVMYYGLMYLTSLKQYLWTTPGMVRPSAWLPPLHRDVMIALLPMVTNSEVDVHRAKQLVGSTAQTVMDWRWQKAHAVETAREGRSHSRGRERGRSRSRSKSTQRSSYSQGKEQERWDPVKEWKATGPWGRNDEDRWEEQIIQTPVSEYNSWLDQSQSAPLDFPKGPMQMMVNRPACGDCGRPFLDMHAVAIHICDSPNPIMWVVCDGCYGRARGMGKTGRTVDLVCGHCGLEAWVYRPGKAIRNREGWEQAQTLLKPIWTHGGPRDMLDGWFNEGTRFNKQFFTAVRTMYTVDHEYYTKVLTVLARDPLIRQYLRFRRQQSGEDWQSEFNGEKQLDEIFDDEPHTEHMSRWLAEYSWYTTWKGWMYDVASDALLIYCVHTVNSLDARAIIMGMVSEKMKALLIALGTDSRLPKDDTNATALLNAEYLARIQTQPNTNTVLDQVTACCPWKDRATQRWIPLLDTICGAEADRHGWFMQGINSVIHLREDRKWSYGSQGISETVSQACREDINWVVTYPDGELAQEWWEPTVEKMNIPPASPETVGYLNGYGGFMLAYCQEWLLNTVDIREPGTVLGQQWDSESVMKAIKIPYMNRPYNGDVYAAGKGGGVAKGQGRAYSRGGKGKGHYSRGRGAPSPMPVDHTVRVEAPVDVDMEADDTVVASPAPETPDAMALM